MKKLKLDKIDLRILKCLQNDGRITNVKLAKKAGISAPPCLRRVRALESSGHIKGYNAKLNHGALGYGVTVFAHVKLQSQAEVDLNLFVDVVQEWPCVREAHMVAGEVDFILKVVAKDWDDYQEFLTHHLTSAANVTSVRSSLAVRVSKDEPGVPIDVD